MNRIVKIEVCKDEVQDLVLVTFEKGQVVDFETWVLSDLILDAETEDDFDADNFLSLCTPVNVPERKDTAALFATYEWEQVFPSVGKE